MSLRESISPTPPDYSYRQNPPPTTLKISESEPENTTLNMAARMDIVDRKETCIVNASILATNWPHKGGKKFNAPLVVDVNLSPS
jgi:hypothetical protein